MKCALGMWPGCDRSRLETSSATSSAREHRRGAMHSLARSSRVATSRIACINLEGAYRGVPVSYTHLRAHETSAHL
eukprot:13889875-Alexandrium_andersonii.AAC.1